MSRLTFVPLRPAFAFRPFAVRNYVDLHVLNKLRTVRIQPSPLCDDSTFVRRAYLDALGFPPSPEEARAFFGGSPAGTRQRRRVVAGSVEPRDAAMVELLYGGGLRVAELTGLDVQASEAARGWVEPVSDHATKNAISISTGQATSGRFTSTWLP